MAQKKTFEQALERLEEISRSLESGETSLEDSLKMYEEGMKLIEFCNTKLNEAQKTIQKLSKTSGGSFETEPLEESVQE
jgi:exodeoxyribonuclease VII small subunit